VSARRRVSTFAVAALLMGVACGEPELTIGFTMPPRARARARSASLRLLEPPPGQNFGCDTLAFGDVDAALERAATVFEQQLPLDGGGGPLRLGALPRVAKKLFVASALDADGRAIAIGCAEVGAIDDDLDVEITAEPIVELVRPLLPPLAFAQGDTRTASVPVGVRDVLGEPAGDVSARWRLLAAGGAQGEGVVRSSRAGVLSVVFSPPPRPGPFLLSLRARWSGRTDLVFEGAVTPSKEVVEIPGRVVAYEAGALGPNGQPGIAAVVVQGAQVRATLVYRTPGASTWTFRNSDPVLLGSLYAPRVVVLPTKRIGAPRDRVILLTGLEWREIAADGSAEPRAIQLPGGAAGITGARAAERCGVPGDPQVVLGLVEGTTTRLRVFDANGASAPNHFLSGLPYDLAAAGCVSSPTGTLLRTFVLRGEGAPIITIERPADDFAAVGWLALGAGITVTPAIGAEPPLLVGTQISLNELVITRARLAHDAAMPDDLTIVGAANDLVPSPFQPEATVGGDVDGDGRLDLVSLLSDDAGDGRPFRRQVWSILGVEAQGRRIAGPLITALSSATPVSLVVTDLDEDGTGDVVLGERPLVGGSTSRLEIYRLGQR
jgi:hypothetical protein